MSKQLKCPMCNNKYNTKTALYSHIESRHPEQIPQGVSVAQYYFNLRYNKTHGTCIICKDETNWNEKSGRYERLCTKPQCSQKFRDMFKKRMMATYGKTTLLDSPEVQKKMLSKRKISGIYTWKNGHKHQYVGSYEKNFLEYMENILSWENPEDILMPCPFVLDYTLNGKKHFFIPDVFIQSLNLIIEIKASTKNNTHHFRLREQEFEKAKDERAKKSPYNYIKIEDNNFSEFSDFLENFKNKD